ncbi:MAG: hypothetical protein N2689_14990, partial [Verrucomicrobiae bacterium]|nr:hypothetical protein [Verrucomicrobiae bacterium]
MSSGFGGVKLPATASMIPKGKGATANFSDRGWLSLAISRIKRSVLAILFFASASLPAQQPPAASSGRGIGVREVLGEAVTPPAYEPVGLISRNVGSGLNTPAGLAVHNST